MRLAPSKQRGKAKREGGTPVSIDHPGRRLIPAAYLAGMAFLIGSSIAALLYGQVDPVPAFLMPWAGFYWAKLFLWRRVIL
jgi:hypothetical protein